MQRIFTHCVPVMLLLFFPLQAAAQVPNSGFEVWSNGVPNGWYANNIPGVFTSVTQSASSRTGSSAARCQPALFMNSVVSPMLQAGSDTGGFPHAVRSTNVRAYYQYFPAASSGDRLLFIVSMTKGSAEIAVGMTFVNGSAASYTLVDIPITYTSDDIPTTCSIMTTIVGPGTLDAPPNIGSYYLLDDVSFSVPAGVNTAAATPTGFTLEQNFPNPFNPSTSIRYTIAERGEAELNVYNLLGNMVATLVSGVKETGTYTASFDALRLSSGIYFYTLRTGSSSETKWMTLLK